MHQLAIYSDYKRVTDIAANELSHGIQESAFPETCTLELTIDIASEHKDSPSHSSGNCPQDVETGMGYGSPVKRQTMTIKSPSQTGIGVEVFGVAISSNEICASFSAG